MFYFIYYLLKSGNFKEKCGGICPLECTTITYPIEYSATTRKLDYTGRNISEGYVKVKVYRISNDYELIVHEAEISADDLLSKIGGLLGILLGASLISLLEIIELIITMVSVVFGENKVHTMKK